MKFIHQLAMFEIRNWILNSQVFTSMGEKYTNKIITVSICMKRLKSYLIDKTKDGTRSHSHFDTIKPIRAYWIYKGQMPTKHEVLRTLISIFATFCLLKFFLVYAKIVLQDIWRTVHDCDDELCDDSFDRWLL